MGNLRAVLSVSLLSIAAACGGGGSDKPDAPIIHVDAAVDTAPDSPPPIDAPSYDFTCLNNSAPTTIAANVAISGTAQEVTYANMAPAINPNPGVSIKVCKGNCTGANLLTTVTSGPNGAYTTGPLTTGGTALDGYLDATKSGDRRTLLYPPAPLAADQPGAPVLQFNTQVFTALNSFGLLSPPQNDASNGVIGVAVTDCTNTPITTGATVVVKQNGVETTGGQTVDLGALAPQAAGTYLVTNVPAGASEVSATVNGMTFRAHTVNSVAGATTATSIRPGF